MIELIECISSHFDIARSTGKEPEAKFVFDTAAVSHNKITVFDHCPA
jgi:hypothetical protein